MSILDGSKIMNLIQNFNFSLGILYHFVGAANMILLFLSFQSVTYCHELIQTVTECNGLVFREFLFLIIHPRLTTPLKILHHFIYHLIDLTLEHSLNAMPRLLQAMIGHSILENVIRPNLLRSIPCSPVGKGCTIVLNYHSKYIITT